MLTAPLSFAGEVNEETVPQEAEQVQPPEAVESSGEETPKPAPAPQASAENEGSTPPEESSAPAEDSDTEPVATQPRRTPPTPSTHPAVPDGYQSDSHGLIAYKVDGLYIDVKGLLGDRWFGTTYGNYGFYPVIRIGDDIYAGGNDIYNGYRGPKEIGEGAGLSVKADPMISSNGRAVYIRYLIKNITDKPITFDFAIAADIKIGDNDDATISMMANERGFILTGGIEDDEEEGPVPTALQPVRSFSLYRGQDTEEAVSLAIFVANTAGVDDADGVWLGDLGDLWENYFINKQEDVADVDSAVSIFWLARTLPAGETATLSVGAAAGDMDVADALVPEEKEGPVEEKTTPEADKTQSSETPKVAPAKVIAKKDASPKTGDKGVFPVAMMMSLALGAAVALRRTGADM